MLFVHGMGEVFSAFATFRSIDYKDTSYCSIVNSEVMLLMTILIALFAYFGTLLCSCWRAVMERQEDNCCSDRWCNCHMGVIWGAWLPPLNSVIPCDDWSPGRLVPVVQSYNLHQEVSERYGLFFRCSGWYCFHLTSSAYLFRSPPVRPERIRGGDKFGLGGVLEIIQVVLVNTWVLILVVLVLVCI